MLLDLFYHLSNEDPNIRGSAAYKLTSTLEQLPMASVGVTGHEDLDYCLKRLLKGLQSNRDKARQGFGMALTELLNILNERSFPIELSTIVNLMEFENCKGHEYRDLLMGKIFGYAAICESTIFDKKGSISYSDEDLKSIYEVLLSMYDKKSYFKPLVSTIVCMFVKKNGSLTPHFVANLPATMEPALSVMISQKIDFSDISIYLHGTTSIAPVLHPVYFFIIQNCPSAQLNEVWSTFEQFLNVDNRKRFLLLKLFNIIIEHFDSKYLSILQDDKIYLLMNKVMSSQSKSLQSITELILSNLKEHCSTIPQIALLMCNFNQLRPYASLESLNESQMSNFIQNDFKVLLLKHLLKSKQYDAFQTYYKQATLDKSDVLTLLKSVMDCPEQITFNLLQFIFKSLDFEHQTLLQSLLSDHKYAPAACLMTCFVITYFELVEIDSDVSSDILKACHFQQMDDNVNSYDVLTDIYIQFMSASSAVVRHLLNLGLKDLTKSMSAVGISMICDLLERPADNMDEDIEEEDDEEEDLTDAMSISTYSEGESQESDDSCSSSVDYESDGQDFEEMVKTAMNQVNNSDDDTDSVNSEQMFKIDKHFEAMFKLKKEAKNTNVNNQHFQSRVLDILESWIKAHNEPELVFKAFLTMYNIRKNGTKESLLSTKCDKIVQYMNNNSMESLKLTKTDDLEMIKEMLTKINLNGNMRVYDAILIQFTYQLDGCTAIIQEKCQKYLKESSLKEIKGLEHVFKDLILTVNGSNMTQILNATSVDAATCVQIFKKVFELDGKMSKLRSQLKPILASLRKLKKVNLLKNDTLEEIVRVINSKTEDMIKEKQQIGALKGIIYSIVEATGIDKKEIVILTK